MATKKTTSQAQRAASSTAKGSKQTTKSASGKKVSQSQKKQIPAKEKVHVPVRLISSTVIAALFVLFLVMFLNPDGALIKLVYHFIQGLFGNVAFYISIPVLLWLFIIHAFSGKKPITMQTVCLIAFVLICGCMTHLLLKTPDIGKGWQFVVDLYKGGIQGVTSGVVCGSIAMLMKLLLGNVISVIILCLCAVLTVLGALNITIPSILRAIENRPRADWEDEDAEQSQEPAAVVVNHIANKHIEHVENRRRVKEEKAQARVMEKPREERNERAEDMMRQIQGANMRPEPVQQMVIQEPPVEKQTVKQVDDSIFSETAQTEPPKKQLTENIPKGMPELEVKPTARTESATQAMEDLAPLEPLEKPKVTAKDAALSAAEVAQEIQEAAQEEKPVYVFPPIDLLKKPYGSGGSGTEEMKENTRRLNETLASFKIEAHIINVTRGPSVTRYEVELDKGVRLNKLTTVADDIALSLGASGVRIAAVPGKISVVGIEVPNRSVTAVSLREVIDSNEFGNAKSKSSFAVGKDIGGNCIVGNIAKLPHMLIAGTTGSGKSVCMNSIIISLLYKASPEDVKLIMIDPKMVELGIYNAIPHLLIPVVTDPKKAAGSLQWAVTEMMRRYKSMSDAGVRDLESYNSIMEAEGCDKLPQVVCIIDELADLMLVAAKEVEESICRIAQMGRAAGIHLIIATQRPSADVITGLMKANIPSRIAFAVASAMESRIILDTMGAEKLVGKGDMLYSPIGSGKPLRVQGCFVTDDEVEAVTSFVKENFNANYDDAVMKDIEKKAAQTGSGKPATASDPEPNDAELDGDEMLPAAVDVILETNQASVSMLQRRLKLGYARAARIVDEMEEKGIVGPFQGSKPREILITKEQWETMKNGQPQQLEIGDMPDEDFGPVPEEID
ncbi:MAG: DNA translocase FtsK [Ruminococcaceae bacterium]|nr:DNA translocase FtsK [Oscillospiraceae bacterium]